MQTAVKVYYAATVLLIIYHKAGSIADKKISDFVRFN